MIGPYPKFLRDIHAGTNYIFYPSVSNNSISVSPHMCGLPYVLMILIISSFLALFVIWTLL